MAFSGISKISTIVLVMLLACFARASWEIDGPITTSQGGGATSLWSGTPPAGYEGYTVNFFVYSSYVLLDGVVQDELPADLLTVINEGVSGGSYPANLLLARVSLYGTKADKQSLFGYFWQHGSYQWGGVVNWSAPSGINYKSDPTNGGTSWANFQSPSQVLAGQVIQGAQGAVFYMRCLACGVVFMTGAYSWRLVCLAKAQDGFW